MTNIPCSHDCIYQNNGLTNFAEENRTNVHRLEIIPKSTHMKRILLTMFCLVAMVFATNAETYTHTFKSGELTTDGGTVTLSDIEWNASTATLIAF